MQGSLVVRLLVIAATHQGLKCIAGDGSPGGDVRRVLARRADEVGVKDAQDALVACPGPALSSANPEAANPGGAATVQARPSQGALVPMISTGSLCRSSSWMIGSSRWITWGSRDGLKIHQGCGSATRCSSHL